MIDQRIVNEIAGNVKPEECQQSDHPITADERSFALEIADEIAERAGIDLAAHVRAFHEQHPQP